MGGPRYRRKTVTEPRSARRPTLPLVLVIVQCVSIGVHLALAGASGPSPLGPLDVAVLAAWCVANGSSVLACVLAFTRLSFLRPGRSRLENRLLLVAGVMAVLWFGWQVWGVVSFNAQRVD
jgi:hypothetical protein